MSRKWKEDVESSSFRALRTLALSSRVCCCYGGGENGVDMIFAREMGGLITLSGDSKCDHSNPKP